MTSNDHFQNKFHFFINQNLSGCYITMIILYSKSMSLFVGRGFLVSHHGLRKPRHFYSLSPLGTISDHNWRVFHLRGDLSLLADTQHIFFVSCNHATMLDVVPFTKPTQSTPTQCRFTNHALTPNSIRCPRAYTMQNATACYLMLHV